MEYRDMLNTHARRRSRSCRRAPVSDWLYPVIIKALINQKNDFVQLGNVFQMIPRANCKDIVKTITKNPESFIIEPDERHLGLNDYSKISIKSPIELCPLNCSKTAKCSGACGKLHICKVFILLNQESCSFKSKCHFGHNLNTRHNAKLLQENNLDQLSVDELRKLFRLPNSRTISTMPPICHYYNTDTKECSRKTCKALHLCQEYLDDDCTSRCCKNHRLENENCPDVLDFFAIDQKWSNGLVFRLLKTFFKRDERPLFPDSREDEDNSSFDESTFDSENEEKPSIENNNFGTGTKIKNDDHQSCSKCAENSLEIGQLKKNMSAALERLESLKTEVLNMKKKMEQKDEENDSSSHQPRKKVATQGPSFYWGSGTRDPLDFSTD